MHRRFQDTTPEIDEKPSIKTKRKFFRFTGGAFNHNIKVALAFLPGLACILLFGGSSVITSIFFALTVGYLFDLFEKPQAVFLVVWISLLIITIQLLNLGIPLVQLAISNIFILGTISVFNLLLGCWISIQFNWLQKSSPQSMVLMERLLFTASPIVISTLVTYTGVALFGVTLAPYMLLVSLVYAQYFLSGPLTSCFRPVKSQLICNEIDQQIQSISLLLMPVFCHVGLVHRNFFSLYNIVNLLTFVNVAIIFLRFTKRYDLLTHFRTQKTEELANIIAMISGGILIFCFEYRVVFTAFYYSIPLPVPLNYIFVTVGLYLAAGIGFIIITGEAKRIGKGPCIGIALACSAVTGIIAGMSFFSLPFLLGAAYFLVEFYFSKNTRDYMIFGVLSSCVAFWFVARAYLFLDFDVEGFSIQHVSVFLVILAVFSVVLPANVFSPQRGVIFAFYAACILYIETIISFTALDIYPFYFVIFTSAVGVKVTHHLQGHELIGRKTTWICMSIFLSKLLIIIATSRDRVLGSALLMLAVLAPHYLHTSQISKKLGWIYCSIITVTSLLTCVVIGGSILELFIERDPLPGGMLFGMWLLTSGMGLFPMITKWFHDYKAMWRLATGLIIAGLSFLIIDPEFGLFISLGGSTPWLLIAGLILTLFCFNSRYVWVRMVYFIAMGLVCSALLVSNTLVWNDWFFLNLWIIFALFFAQLNCMYVPTAMTMKYGVWILGGFFAMFFIAVVSSSIGVSHLAPKVAALYLRQYKNSLLGIYAASTIFLALLYKFLLTSPKNSPGSKHTAQVQTPGSFRFYEEMSNACTIFGYGLAVTFSIYLLKMQISPLILSPLLLLLNKDKYLFKWLKEGNRYVPVIVGCVLGFSVVSLWSISYLLISGRFKSVLLREILFLLCALPTNGLMIEYLYTKQRRPTLWWLVVVPLNVLAVFSSYTTTVGLAVSGLLCGTAYGLLFLYSRQFTKINL